MDTNKQLITKLYKSFASFEPGGMADCYHEDIEFEDPAFGLLQGEDVMHMWRMLIHRGKPNLEISFERIQADDKQGSVHWEAIYPFSMTGNTVHNQIDASFHFQDGKIIKHVDRFDLHQWAAMAFGWKGKLFGGLAFFQNKIRSKAKMGLEKWKEKQ
jgi:ketosteroid isomerase-like protein